MMIGELRDVNHAILTRQELHKHTVALNALHSTRIDTPNLGVLGQCANLLHRTVYRSSICPSNVDIALVLNVDLHIATLLNGTNRLTTRPNHRADLLRVDLDGDHTWRVVAQGFTRLGNRGHNHIQNLHTGVTGLLERLAQHITRHTVDLDVHLQRRDPHVRASDLKVHVAQVIL